MQLCRLRLTNVCQHRELDWRFGPGITGIFGPNGSGKSNALKMAYSSLTNDFTRNAGVRADNICLQADESEPSKIVTDWLHGGVEFSIRLDLRAETRELRIRSEVYTKATEIQEVLEKTIGLKRRLIDDHVFVDQWKIFDFLSSTPAVRAKSFAHLCDTTHSETCWALTGKQLDLDLALTQAPEDDKDAARAAIALAREEARDAKYKLDMARKLLAPEADVMKAEELLQRRQAFVALTKQYREARKSRDDLRERMAALKEDARRQSARFSEIGHQVATAALAAGEAQQALVQQEQRAKRAARRRQVVSTLAVLESELGSLVEPVVPCPETHERLVEELRLLMIDTSRNEALISGCDGQVDCPTCGTPTDQLADKIAKAKADLPEMRARDRLLCEKIDSLHAYRVGLRNYHKDKERAEDKVLLLRDELSGLEEDSEVERSPDKLRAVIAEHKELKLREGQLGVQAQSAKSALSAAEGQSEATQEQLVRLRTAADAAKVTKDDADNCRQFLIDSRAATKEVAELTLTFRLKKREFDVAKERLDRINVLVARAKKAKVWTGLLTSLREVFHRDNLPRIVASHDLAAMQDDINKTLVDFDEPFSVSVDEQLDFIVSNPDGTEEMASRLSGGEQVVLAIAFRWAVSDVFASGVDMMVLDEPTAGLDAQNLVYLESALRRLSRTAKKQNRQLIMITHERILEPVFDQVLSLQREGR